MGKTEQGRLAYADRLRAAAIVAVIVVHMAGSQLGAVAIGSAPWQAFNLYDGLAHWCVPVFVMLSGMFLLDPARPLSLGKLFFHHILRIAVALAVWGTLYALADHWLATGEGVSWASLKSALYSVLLGNTHYHLWFLYMIIGLYLVTPVLRAFVRGAQRRDFHILFALVFLFTFLIPTVLRLRPSQTLSAYVSYLNVKLVLGYVGYYVLGYYLKHYTLNRAAEIVIYLLGAAGAAVTVGGTALLSAQQGRLVHALYEYDSPNVALMSVAVFVLFRYVLGSSEERSRRRSTSAVARLAFGIYLVHEFFIMALRQWGITTLSFAPALSVPVLTAAVFLCAFAVAWVISKIPLLGRYLT